MAFCINCGQELVEGAKFCQKCGCSTGTGNIEDYTKRQQEFAGKIYKCPNCGEVLKSFVINCPTCGFELRGNKPSRAVKEFAQKLEAIEAKREYEKPAGMFNLAAKLQNVSKTDEQKISLIKSFAVPNSKEDILEFMILAVSSMDMDAYDSSKTNVAKSVKEVNAAWLAKVNQVYEKAKRVYSSEDVFAEIKELYDECNQNIVKSKKKGVIKWILMFVLPIIIFAVVLIPLIISEPKEEEKELKRLESIVEDVKVALEAEEYRHALRTADSIDYQRYDVEEERKWDLQREYWVEKVIDEANKRGIVLEYTYTEDVDKANDDSHNDSDKGDTSGGFVDGFMEGVSSGGDTVKQNFEEFKQNLKSSSTSGSSDKKDNLATNDSGTSETIADIDVSIKKGSQYTFGASEFDLYLITAISDSKVKVEKMGKNLSSQTTFSNEYDVGIFNISDQGNEFQWLDSKKKAFRFHLKDDDNWDYRKGKNVVFTVLGTEEDENQGTNCNSKSKIYEYLDDDWHKYRAVKLSGNWIKIECWCRSTSLGKFHYGYDVVLVNEKKNNTFEWTDDSKDSFTITLKDSENGDLKKGKVVLFES